MKHFLGYLLALMIFWACNPEDEITPIIGSIYVDDLIKPDTIQVLSLTVDPSYQTNQTDDWVVVSTATGKLLGWAPFESGDQLVLEAFTNSRPSFVTVTILQILETGMRTNYNVQSYARIPRGVNWNLSRLIETKRNALGNIDIMIQNSPWPSFAFFQASDNFGGQSYSSFYNQGTTTLDFTLFEGISRIGITISTLNDEIKYLEIEKPVLNANYTYDFVYDFVSPDHEALISMGSNIYVNAVIRGLPDLKYNRNLRLKGMALTEAFYPNGAEQVPLGYNNGFSHYYTELIVDKESYQYRYEKLGTAPALGNISIPANPIRIEDNTFSGFSITGGAAYTHLQNSWSHTTISDGREYIITWSVYSPRGAYPVLNELPEEILTEYPFLDINHDQMSLDYVNTYRNFSNFSYDDMIGELIKEKEEDYRPHEFEMITLTD